MAFQRIHLESGQRALIAFTLGAAELDLWNRELRQVVEPGWFTVRVGASSADIRGEERFEVSQLRTALAAAGSFNKQEVRHV